MISFIRLDIFTKCTFFSAMVKSWGWVVVWWWWWPMRLYCHLLGLGVGALSIFHSHFPIPISHSHPQLSMHLALVCLNPHLFGTDSLQGPSESIKGALREHKENTERVL